MKVLRPLVLSSRMLLPPRGLRSKRVLQWKRARLPVGPKVYQENNVRPWKRIVSAMEPLFLCYGVAYELTRFLWFRSVVFR